MTAGVLMLVAIGLEDIFLTGDPQITFFKSIYRRYTNFSLEEIRQPFDQESIKLGQKITCTLSKQGDLCGPTYLYVELPSIPKYITDECDDPIKKFSWARKLGFVIIKYATIEIGGEEIDRQYGEWLNIFSEMTHTQPRALNNMVGNIPDLYNFDNGKGPAILYIPLQFWFCRHFSSSLPLIGMHYNDIKIHIQLNDPENCYLLGPTNYIDLIDDLVLFDPYELIYQKIDDHSIYGIFMNFDPVLRRLYYVSLNSTNTLYFKGLDKTEISQQYGATDDVLNSLRQDYVITGDQSGYTVFPQDDQVEETYSIALPDPLTDDINLINCQLSTLYIYLDSEERSRFSTIPHEYLIEQVQFIPDKSYNSLTISQKLGFDHPVKEIIWMSQYSYMEKSKDWFNYTDKPWRTSTNKKNGNLLNDNSTIYLNAQKRFSTKPAEYFNYVQPIQHHSNSITKGANVYSFAVFPENSQGSGSCNMSRINDISLKTTLKSTADLTFKITQRAYCVNYNVLRIISGNAGVLFNN